MRKKIPIICLIIGCILTNLSAKDIFKDSEDRVKRHNVGINLGITSGMGLSYRHWLSNGYGFSLTAFPYWKINKNKSDVNLNAGLGLYKSFYVGNFINIFGYLGAAVFWDYLNYKNGYIQDSWYDESERDIKEINVGLGPGMEFHFSYFNISTILGIASTNEESSGVYTYGITPTGEVSFFFNF